MNFKVDENLPVEVAELLNQAGHDAVTVCQQNLLMQLESTESKQEASLSIGELLDGAIQL